MTYWVLKLPETSMRVLYLFYKLKCWACSWMPSGKHWIHKMIWGRTECKLHLNQLNAKCPSTLLGIWVRKLLTKYRIFFFPKAFHWGLSETQTFPPNCAGCIPSYRVVCNNRSGQCTSWPSGTHSGHSCRHPALHYVLRAAQWEEDFCFSSRFHLNVSALFLAHPLALSFGLSPTPCFSACCLLLSIPPDLVYLFPRQVIRMSGPTYFGAHNIQHKVTCKGIWHKKHSDLQRATFMVVLADCNVESYLIITLWL